MSLRSRLGARRPRLCAQGSPPRRRSRPRTCRSCSSTHTRRRRLLSALRSRSSGRCSVSELTLVEAINDAFHTELARDDSVLVMGEDVSRAGGVFRATAGLRDKFGVDRCVDTPLAEAGIIGTAVGLCMAGWRPRGGMEFPLVVRMPYGGGVRAPELHDDSPEAYYAHTPGVKVAIPATPADAKGLLAAAIRDPDPVVVLEPKLHYRTMRGEVPEGEHVVPLGGEASAEVLDLRTLKPLDQEALLASAAKTGRVVIVQEAPRTAGLRAKV